MKNKLSPILSKFRENFFSEKEVGGRRRLYNSLWALLFGVLASILIIAITGNNPFEVFQVIFQDATSQTIRFTTTIVVFIIATLGTALCFKSGIFNIGISGQMMAGGITTVMVLKLIDTNGGTIVLALLLAIISGALVAAVAGALKAFLKVNEVVSTILLNWVIFYIIKFIIQSNIPGLVSLTSLAQNQTDSVIMPAFFQSTGWLVLISIFSVVMIGGIWFLFAKTTIGYKMKMLALNKEASKYAGSNEQLILILIMAISGALSGLAGFLYYTEIGVVTADSEPITIGFDTIAIALLVYNNPLGIGISSILFAIIKLGCGALKPLFPPLTQDFAQIMFGIIIYVAAIGIVFERFQVYTYIKNKFIYWKDPTYKEIKNIYWANKKSIYSAQRENITLIRNIKKEYSHIWKDIKKQSIAKKEALDKEMLSDKKILSNLTHEEQQYYFEQILLIKKTKDKELFDNKYFEVFTIKSGVKSFKNDNKVMLHERRKEILEAHKIKMQEKALLKGSEDGNI